MDHQASEERLNMKDREKNKQTKRKANRRKQRPCKEKKIFKNYHKYPQRNRRHYSIYSRKFKKAH